MKLSYRKICRSNEGVSEVVGGLMLIMIVASFMTSLMWISNAYIDMQKNVVNANMDLIQEFIENLSVLFPPTTPGNTPPEIRDPHPTDFEKDVPLAPTCSVMVIDKDKNDTQLFVTFFFYGPEDSAESVTDSKPVTYSFIVESNTMVKCTDERATLYKTMYSWEVSVSDSTVTVTSDRYYFTTVEQLSTNRPPEIHKPIWPSEVTGVQLYPNAYLWVSDPDGDTVTVTFHLDDPGCGCGYDEGAVILDLGAASAKAQCVLRDAEDYDTDYGWSVTITDGYNLVTSPTYKFGTVSSPT